MTATKHSLDESNSSAKQLHKAHRAVEHAYRALTRWYTGMDRTLPRSKIEQGMLIVRRASEVRSLLENVFPNVHHGRSDAALDGSDGPAALIAHEGGRSVLYVHGELVKSVSQFDKDRDGALESLEALANRINVAAAKE